MGNAADASRIRRLIPTRARALMKSWIGRFVELRPPYAHADITAQEWEILRAAMAISLSSHERFVGLTRAVDYLVDNRIGGAIVECGVYKGASMLAAAMRLVQRGDTGRDLWLYDTFEGMTVPQERDVDYRGRPAMNDFRKYQIDDSRSTWAGASVDEVKAIMAQAKYTGPMHYVQGKVEDTLPAQLPGPIALLRLDTDWYASTKHELEQLYPLLVPGGVLIIDDYGHYQGCREAVDEYLATLPYPVHLSRMDYSGRLAIKPPV